MRASLYVCMHVCMQISMHIMLCVLWMHARWGVGVPQKPGLTLRVRHPPGRFCGAAGQSNGVAEFLMLLWDSVSLCMCVSFLLVLWLSLGPLCVCLCISCMRAHHACMHAKDACMAKDACALVAEWSRVWKQQFRRARRTTCTTNCSPHRWSTPQARWPYICMLACACILCMHAYYASILCMHACILGVHACMHNMHACMHA